MNDIAKVEKKELNVVDNGASVMAMLQSAVERGADPDALEKLVALQERIMDREAEMAYTAAMVAVQGKIPYIHNESKNSQTGSSYAKLDKINKIIIPIYTKHGFSLSFGTGVSQLEGWTRITCDVLHERGHSKNYYIDLPLDDVGLKGNANKTKMHASGSTRSYGSRYLTNMIFNLTTGDDDDGNGAVEYITEQQVADLDCKISELGRDKDGFLKFLKVDSLEELPANKYVGAIKALEAKAKQNAAA